MSAEHPPLEIKFFAQVREVAGTDNTQLDWCEGDTLGTVKARLAEMNQAFARAMTGSLMVARNQTLCDESEPLEPGDEVAFFPPVTGG